MLHSALLLPGQPVLDGFDPNANGIIRTIAVQPDGKILIGGIFTTLAPNGGPPVTRNRIARLNADGTLDPDFNPDANSDVFSLAVQPDGKILVGGYFTSIGGQFRNRLARLDPTNGLADSFNPNANDVVRSIVVQTNGMILAGGDFIVIGGASRRGMARLDTNGLADASFNPSASANSGVYSIVLQADGKILAGGTFTSLGGQTRNRIARLDASTGLADSFDPNVDNDVLSLALQPDGKIVVGGFFNSIGGQTRNYIARLNPVTGLPDSFDPNANTTVQSVAIQADGAILAGGGFTSIGGQPRGRLARLDAITGAADSFNPNAGGAVSAVKLQADGKILAAGIFTTMSTQPRNRIARFAPPPPLLLSVRLHAGTNVVLSWSTNYSGFSLASKGDLNAPLWTLASPPPTVVGDNYVVTNPASGAARFFRLQK